MATFTHTRDRYGLTTTCTRCRDEDWFSSDSKAERWQRGHVCGRNAPHSVHSRPLAAAQHENDHSPTPTHESAQETP